MGKQNSFLYYDRFQLKRKVCFRFKKVCDERREKGKRKERKRKRMKKRDSFNTWKDMVLAKLIPA